MQRKNTRRDSLKAMGEFLVVVFVFCTVFPMFFFFAPPPCLLRVKRWVGGGASAV